MPAPVADKQDLTRDTAVSTPVTLHSALVGVRNAIDASYVSCQRHLSRRVTQPATVGNVSQQQHPFNGPLSGTTQVSWYQKGKFN